LDRDGDGVACETGGDAPAYVPVSGPTVVVGWTGTDCIHITVPTAGTRSQQIVNRCGGRTDIGGAATLSCAILDGRVLDSGVAGDGHDVNCLTTVGQLN
jgi:hypothetical protein